MSSSAIPVRPHLRTRLAAMALLTGPYLLVLAYFAYVDVYHAHFFGPDYARSYNVLSLHSPDDALISTTLTPIQI
jgi:hypothetical protein